MGAETTRPRKRLTGRLVSVVAAVVGSVLLVHSGWNWVAGRRLARTIRTQSAAGVPMALKLVLPEPIPDRRNAAVPLRRAFALIGGDSVSTGAQAVARALLRYHDDALSREPEFALSHLSAERRAALRNLIGHADLAPLFALLEAAAEGLPAQFAVDYQQGAAVLLPHLAPLRRCLRILATRAWTRADAGDMSGALSDLRRCLRLTRGLAHEPVVLAQLSRAACDNRTCGLLRTVTAGTPVDQLDKALLWGLIAALEEVNDPQHAAFARAIDGERIIFGGWLFLSFLAGRGDLDRLEAVGLPRWVRHYARYPSRPLLKDDARVYLERMVACSAAVRAGDASQLQAVFAQKAPMRCPLTRRMMPVLGTAWQAVAIRQVQVQLAEVGLRLALYAQTNGAYPDSIEVLEGVAVPTLCPFGQPLVYQRRGDTYRLYSVGPNGDDDGGIDRLADGRMADCVWQ
jgi:hypothetical protein